MTRKLLAASVLIIIIASMLIAGCTSSTNTASPTEASQTRTALISPGPTSSAQQSSSAAIGAPTRLATVVGPESHADSWLLAGVPVERGSDIRVYTELYSPSEGKYICGAVNYYIDDRAAGGEWHVSSGDSCQSIAGWLHLSASDTMQLSAGVHTFKMDYLGNSTYAPSQFVAQFTVR
ncbi:MAG: hypothetical protein ACXV2B_03400 [Halobacteriota archaeon]